MAKIYVASSWRNSFQPHVVNFFRARGHEAYDFREPEAGESGFAWAEIDPNWESWDFNAYVRALRHPAAEHGFEKDLGAMKWCDACVLVQPCGRSAHLELGWCAGHGKRTAILMHPDFEPELMIKVADLITPSLEVISEWLNAA